AFTQRLLQIYARKDLDQPFEELWPDDYTGLRTIDRRLGGTFLDTDEDADGVDASVLWHAGGDGPGRRDPLVQILLEEEDVANQLLRIHDHAAVQDAERFGGGRFDLLDRLVALLPAEARENPEQVMELARTVLDTLESRLREDDGGRALAALSENGALNKHMYAIARSMFGRRGPSLRSLLEDPAEQTPRKQGHKGDEKVADDVDALLADVMELPKTDDPKLLLLDAESSAEQVGVYLHYLTHVESPESVPGLRGGLARLLRTARSEDVDVLMEFFEAFEYRADRPRHAPATDPIRAFLRKDGLGRLVRDRAWLAMERVVESFPLDFELFLDALDPSRPEDLDALDIACDAIGKERIRATSSSRARPPRCRRWRPSSSNGAGIRFARTSSPSCESCTSTRGRHVSCGSSKSRTSSPSPTSPDCWKATRRHPSVWPPKSAHCCAASCGRRRVFPPLKADAWPRWATCAPSVRTKRASSSSRSSEPVGFPSCPRSRRRSAGRRGPRFRSSNSEG
ncbi:MAG: hypothetical protein ACYTG6_11245, partial [Planctomycetota bacterium]